MTRGIENAKRRLGVQQHTGTGPDETPQVRQGPHHLRRTDGSGDTTNSLFTWPGISLYSFGYATVADTAAAPTTRELSVESMVEDSEESL